MALSYTTAEQLAVGEQLALKLAQRYQREATRAKQQKIVQALVQKGFSFDIAQTVVAQIDFANDEDTERASDQQVTETIQDAVLARLKELGYVDDFNYAKHYVATKKRLSPKGPVAISLALQQAGVPASAITQALAIDLDNVFAFGVAESVLIKYGLAKGRELDDALIAQIKYDDAIAKALNTALNYLGHALRTEKQIRQKLLCQGYCVLYKA
ncbi:hypothetical protein GQS40_08700|uniref:Regulatory protein RecX n=1 Tax=Leuconostoc lactis TaxID=1246 RepID=A0A6L7AE03_LEULA|nr:hypothetical protein [Leuconostoc lactis]